MHTAIMKIINNNLKYSIKKNKYLITSKNDEKYFKRFLQFGINVLLLLHNQNTNFFLTFEQILKYYSFLLL